MNYLIFWAGTAAYIKVHQKLFPLLQDKIKPWCEIWYKVLVGVGFQASCCNLRVQNNWKRKKKKKPNEQSQSNSECRKWSFDMCLLSSGCSSAQLLFCKWSSWEVRYNVCFHPPKVVSGISPFQKSSLEYCEDNHLHVNETKFSLHVTYNIRNKFRSLR